MHDATLRRVHRARFAGHSNTMNRMRSSATVVLLAAMLCLPSCFTLGLWGFTPETETDDRGREEEVMVYDPETEWSWSLLGLRVLLTPVTLTLDLATAPLQALFWATDDDDCPPP